MLLRELLVKTAADKGLRESTLYSYRRLLLRMGIEDNSLSLEEVQARLFQIDNVNSRRAAAIAARSVLNMPQLRIPKAVPRRYVLPGEDELKLALMLSPHEVRGLLMMYAGLRIGEACAVTASQVAGDRLTVDRQVVELHASARQTGGEPTKVLRIGPVKSNEADVVIPHWLTPRLDSLTTTVKPGSVRESLRRAGQRVGISLNPHMLRHWYATESLKRGLPVALVSRQMRHSDIAVTLRTYQAFSENDDIYGAWG